MKKKDRHRRSGSETNILIKRHPTPTVAALGTEGGCRRLFFARHIVIYLCRRDKLQVLLPPLLPDRPRVLSGLVCRETAASRSLHRMPRDTGSPRSRRNTGSGVSTFLEAPRADMTRRQVFIGWKTEKDGVARAGRPLTGIHLRRGRHLSFPDYTPTFSQAPHFDGRLA